uniref:Chitin-binding type-2 domain-containing protein n=1 Tax=Lepeophtheirus salmonis TaxID=72036 RepID=A0A0K2UUV0_LEPSM
MYRFMVLLLVVGLVYSEAKPWIQGVDLSLPREVDPENPIQAHPDDCKVFYVYNYPMTCGEELVFSQESLSCVPKEKRPECA